MSQAALRGEGIVIADTRFRDLLPREAWSSIPHEVRLRFTKRLSDGATAVYVGRTTEMRMTRAGRWLAQLMRIAGAPLPLHDDTGAACVVTVTEDVRQAGQTWTRIYANRQRFPQIIQSSKRFRGHTGLEEYIGFGISIALRARAVPGGIAFDDDGYAIGAGRFRIWVPKALQPGRMTVTHVETGQGEFAFTLSLRHRVLGEIVHQTGVYREARP